MRIQRLKQTFLRAFILGLFSILISVQPVSAAGGDGDGKFNVTEAIFHHISDANEAHFMWFKVPLPVMIYNRDKGSWFFSTSNKFHTDSHGTGTEKIDGYKMYHGRVEAVDGSSIIDFSITKNVFWMLICGFLMIFLFTRAAKAYKGREDEAPTGFQNLMETMILFIKEEIADPNIGTHASYKYVPYLATLFFFILFLNLFGLIPFIGNPNISGNIVITALLAVMTMVIVYLSGNKHYWGHMFWMPGIPTPMKILMAVIEFIANFLVKPASLAIRLFANITAGHMIILALVSLVFVFSSVNGQPGLNTGGGIAGVAAAVPFLAFMNLIELLVAFLQAYIFTMLASLYIGEAVAVHDHDEHH